MTLELHCGQLVSIKGAKGYFKVTAIHPTHVEVFGGDKDPKGRRSFRAVAPDRLRPRKPNDTERRQGG